MILCIGQVCLKCFYFEKTSAVLRFILGYQFRPCWKSRKSSLWQLRHQNDQPLSYWEHIYTLDFLFFNQNKVRFSNVSLLIIVSVTQLSYQGSPFSHTGTSSFHLQLLSVFLMKEMISSHYIIHNKHGKMCHFESCHSVFWATISWIFFRSIISWKLLSIICFGFQYLISSGKDLITPFSCIWRFI